MHIYDSDLVKVVVNRLSLFMIKFFRKSGKESIYIYMIRVIDGLV